MSDWKSIIGAVAPTLASVLGGPLAGAAVSALSRSLLDKDSAPLEEIAQAVSAGTPEVLAKIKEAEAQMRTRLRELDIDAERVAAQDRDSARQREIAVKDRTPAKLAWTFVGGYFVIFVTVMKTGVDESMQTIVTTLLGMLSAGIMSIMNYYFGSSTGSKHKSEILDRVANHR